MKDRPYDWDGLHGDLPEGGEFYFNMRGAHRQISQRMLEQGTADARKIGRDLSTLIHRIYRIFVKNKPQGDYALELGVG